MPDMEALRPKPFSTGPGPTNRSGAQCRQELAWMTGDSACSFPLLTVSCAQSVTAAFDFSPKIGPFQLSMSRQALQAASLVSSIPRLGLPIRHTLRNLCSTPILSFACCNIPLFHSGSASSRLPRTFITMYTSHTNKITYYIESSPYPLSSHDLSYHPTTTLINTSLFRVFLTVLFPCFITAKLDLYATTSTPSTVISKSASKHTATFLLSKSPNSTFDLQSNLHLSRTQSPIFHCFSLSASQPIHPFNFSFV